MKTSRARGPAFGAFFVALLWATSWGVSVTNAAPPRSWEQARADEASALAAERDALRASLRTAKSSAAAAKASLRKDIERLSTELTRLNVTNAELGRDLPARERDRSREAQNASLADLMRRLAARTQTPLPEDADARAALLPQLVDTELQDLSSTGSLRLDPHAEVFDLSGHAVEKVVLHVGGVAALTWGEDIRPLIATAQGLQMVPGNVTAPQQHDEATIVSAVLYDAAAPPDPASFASTGWREKMDAGGPVMWVLLGIGVIAAMVVLERTVSLAWAGLRWRYEARRFAAAVRDVRTRSLLEVQGWIAKPLVIAASARCPSCSATLDVDVEERATQALMVMREQLQRRLSLVNVAAGVAPLLGLLGTVTGMIHTFSVVTDTGTAEPQLLAAGISEALLTTQFGLAIAIPAYLAHALLSRGARRILASAEQAVLAYLHGGEGHDHDHDHDGSPHQDEPAHG